MKFIAILFAITAVSLAQQESFKIPQDIAEKVRNNAIPCADENKVDHSMIDKLPTGTLPNDEPHSKFLYCFALRSGYITEDGHMVPDKLATLLKDHPKLDTFKAALAQCNEITLDTPLKTAMAMHKCFAERPSLRLVL